MVKTVAAEVGVTLFVHKASYGTGLFAAFKKLAAAKYNGSFEKVSAEEMRTLFLEHKSRTPSIEFRCHYDKDTKAEATEVKTVGKKQRTGETDKEHACGACVCVTYDVLTHLWAVEEIQNVHSGHYKDEPRFLT